MTILTPCPNGHTNDDDNNGTVLLAFYEGERPQTVMREITEHIVTENATLLRQRTFRPGLLFRLGDTDQVVTLVDPREVAITADNPYNEAERAEAEAAGEIDFDDEAKVRLKPVTAVELSTIAADRFCFINPTKNNETRHQPLPAWFARDFLLRGIHKLPQLNGVLRHPAVRLDGSVEMAEGYDPITKCWVDGDFTKFNVSDQPTDEELADAIALLREPMSEMIFEGDEVVGQSPVKKPGTDMTASEANLLSTPFSIMFVRQMPDTPFHGLTSIQEGTAKGLALNMWTLAVTGRKALTVPLETTVHMNNQLIGKTFKQHPGQMVLQFDEPDDGKSFFSRMLSAIGTDGGTSVLRTSLDADAPEVDTKRIVAFTGINFRPDRDMVRRVIMIEFGVPADMTMPNERVFKSKDRANKSLLLQWMRDYRPELLHAMLVLIAHWRAEKRPPAPFNFDFPEWMATIGGIMHAAGIESWMTNRHGVRARADEARRGDFLLALAKLVKARSTFTAATLAEQIVIHDSKTTTDPMADRITWDDANARRLMKALDSKNKKAIARALGQWFHAISGRILVSQSGKAKVIVKSAGFERANKQLWTFVVRR